MTAIAAMQEQNPTLGFGSMFNVARDGCPHLQVEGISFFRIADDQFSYFAGDL